MKDYHWTEMMEKMQDIRLFSGLHIRRSRNEGITSSQELDLLSHVVLSEVPMTPHDLCSTMGLSKSAVSRLIEHLEKKEFLYKETNPTDKRSVLSEVPMTPHDLCSTMGLSKSAVSRLIEHLEKKEFLYKETNPTDKRSYSLRITEKGNDELNLTYAYYLEPIYQLRRVLGDERFDSLTTKIKEANELLLKEKGR